MKHINTILLLFFASASMAQNSLPFQSSKEPYIYKSNTTNLITVNKKTFQDKQTSLFSLSKGEGKISDIDITFKEIRNERRKQDSVTIIDTNHPRYALSYHLKELTNRKLRVRIGKNGLTKDTIGGLEEAYSHIYDAYLTKPDSIEFENTKYGINQSFGEFYIRSILENILTSTPYSKKPIKEGDTWEFESHFNNNIKSIFVTKSQIIKSANNEINIKGFTNVEGDTAYFAYDGSKYLLSELKGEIKSSLTVDTKELVLKKGTYSMKLEGHATALSMEGKTDYAIKQPIEINIIQTISKE